jgi:hypothetical protein
MYEPMGVTMCVCRYRCIYIYILQVNELHAIGVFYIRVSRKKGVKEGRKKRRKEVASLHVTSLPFK